MPRIEYILNDEFAIVAPNVGDAELKTIAFEHPDVVIGLYLPMASVHVCFEMVSVSFLSFWSDHPQNVIDKVSIFPQLSAARLPDCARVELLLRDKLDAARGPVLTIEPIAGPSLICCAASIGLSTGVFR